MGSIILFILTYLVARRAVQNWRELCILLFAIGAIIAFANLLGLEKSIDFGQSKISFSSTFFDNLTVLISATIMLIVQSRKSSKPSANADVR
jgi:hypothetical protein